MPNLMNPNTTYVEHTHTLEFSDSNIGLIDKLMEDQEPKETLDTDEPKFSERIRYERSKGSSRMTRMALEQELNAIETLSDLGYGFGLHSFILPSGDEFNERLDEVTDFLVRRIPSNQTVKIMVIRIG